MLFTFSLFIFKYEKQFYNKIKVKNPKIFMSIFKKWMKMNGKIFKMTYINIK